MKCYKIIIQGYDDECGVIYAPQDWGYPIAEDGKEVNNWQSLKLELRDGIYCHYHMCIGGANLVDDEMKRLFEQYITEDTQIEFLPVQVYSEIYGEKRYYILHFKKIHDVLDLEHTVYSYNRRSIIKPVFNISKVRGMHLFNSRPAISDVNVSEMLYKAIKKNNLAKGIQFQPIKCL
jgi:hypothetical protein